MPNHPSAKETSEKIRKRTQELIAEEKLKPGKGLQDRGHKLSQPLQILIAIIALIALAFSVGSYNGWL